VTWRSSPSLGSILRAVESTNVGGDTLFANMDLAYERLDEDTKNQIKNLVAVHDIARVFAMLLKTDTEELRAKYLPSEHPVVRTHPETGRRSIYVNTAFTNYIKGMEQAQSTALLDRQYKTARNPEVQCRLRWQPGSLAFWDSRASQHFAAAGYFPEVTKREPVTTTGNKPYFDPSR